MDILYSVLYIHLYYIVLSVTVYLFVVLILIGKFFKNYSIHLHVRVLSKGSQATCRQKIMTKYIEPTIIVYIFIFIFCDLKKNNCAIK